MLKTCILTLVYPCTSTDGRIYRLTIHSHTEPTTPPLSHTGNVLIGWDAISQT